MTASGALTVACPACGVPAGKGCAIARGGVTVHLDRRDLAEQHARVAAFEARHRR